MRESTQAHTVEHETEDRDDWMTCSGEAARYEGDLAPCGGAGNDQDSSEGYHAGLVDVIRDVKRKEEMNAETLIEVDGSIGEGGGQILRSSLTLSLVTGKPFLIRHLRAGRRKPGLLRQHLTALNAAAEIGGANVSGAVLGSQEVEFRPGEIRPGHYRFSVGTAGSATLVLQTVLPALLTAGERSDLVLQGGTHNPFAPPFDFLERVLLPLLGRMGARIKSRLDRFGFYPAGGGKFRVEIEPCEKLSRLDLLERGEIVRRTAVARVANLSPKIAARELATVKNLLSWKKDWLREEQVRKASGPGNVLTLEIESENVTELFTGFGMRGVSAERVAEKVVGEVREYLACGAPVGPHLADQLLIPMALAGGGRFRTAAPTRHTLTNIEIVKTFVDVRIEVEKEEGGHWRIELDSSGEESKG